VGPPLGWGALIGGADTCGAGGGEYTRGGGAIRGAGGGVYVRGAGIGDGRGAGGVTRCGIGITGDPCAGVDRKTGRVGAIVGGFDPTGASPRPDCIGDCTRTLLPPPAKP
jgi:hypothetical protein